MDFFSDSQEFIQLFDEANNMAVMQTARSAAFTVISNLLDGMANKIDTIAVKSYPELLENCRQLIDDAYNCLQNFQMVIDDLDDIINKDRIELSEVQKNLSTMLDTYSKSVQAAADLERVLQLLHSDIDNCVMNGVEPSAVANTKARIDVLQSKFCKDEKLFNDLKIALSNSEGRVSKLNSDLEVKIKMRDELQTQANNIREAIVAIDQAIEETSTEKDLRESSEKITEIKEKFMETFAPNSQREPNLELDVEFEDM
jgi:chromosome segregation ATPase